MTQYGFYINVERCTGCKTCMMACKDKNNPPEGKNLRRVTEFSGGKWIQNADGSWKTDTFAYYVSIGCNHCADPACVKVCPTKAHFKDSKTGLVLIEKSKCIGCGACAAACPYGAPQLDVKAHKMCKCDACLDRIQAGRQPSCVEACPQRAIEFGDIEALRKKHGKLATIAPLPIESMTRPSLVIGPSRNVRKAGTEGRVHWPLKG